jgi:hypothetical protein
MNEKQIFSNIVDTYFSPKKPHLNGEGGKRNCVIEEGEKEREKEKRKRERKRREERKASLTMAKQLWTAGEDEEKWIKEEHHHMKYTPHDDAEVFPPSLSPLLLFPSLPLFNESLFHLFNFLLPLPWQKKLGEDVFPGEACCGCEDTLWDEWTPTLYRFPHGTSLLRGCFWGTLFFSLSLLFHFFLSF